MGRVTTMKMGPNNMSGVIQALGKFFFDTDY